MTCLDCFTRKAFTSYFEGKKPSTNNTMAKVVINCPETVYSHLSNKRGGWNKRGGGAKVAESINVEVGITVEVGFFLKNQ